MFWATIFTLTIAVLLLKKRKVKEFFLFLAILIVLFLPSFESFFDIYINLPLKKFAFYNHEATKLMFSSLPAIIKMVFFVFSSISIACVVYYQTIKYILHFKSKEQIESVINCHKESCGLCHKLFISFKKPNMKITA